MPGSGLGYASLSKETKTFYFNFFKSYPNINEAPKDSQNRAKLPPINQKHSNHKYINQEQITTQPKRVFDENSNLTYNNEFTYGLFDFCSDCGETAFGILCNPW